MPYTTSPLSPYPTSTLAPFPTPNFPPHQTASHTHLESDGYAPHLRSNPPLPHLTRTSDTFSKKMVTFCQNAPKNGKKRNLPHELFRELRRHLGLWARNRGSPSRRDLLGSGDFAGCRLGRVPGGLGRCWSWRRCFFAGGRPGVGLWGAVRTLFWPVFFGRLLSLLLMDIVGLSLNIKFILKFGSWELGFIDQVLEYIFKLPPEILNLVSPLNYKNQRFPKSHIII